MKPITINITNLIGTMVINDDKENTSEQIQEKVTEALLKVINNATDFQNKKTNDYSLTIKHDDTISFNANEASDILDRIKLKSEYLSKNEHYHCVIVMYKITS